MIKTKKIPLITVKIVKLFKTGRCYLVTISILLVLLPLANSQLDPDQCLAPDGQQIIRNIKDRENL